tara:strand:+ start:6213 stop:10001 length:3789 start_codon:yes stop_codon:yes gene_type:complete
MNCSYIKNLLFFLFLSSSLFANNIKFQSLSTSDGLSQSSINTVLQDKAGFMWFGTQNGLNKYDGYRFDNYRSSLTDSNAIGGNRINDLIQTNDGLIWIATESGISSYCSKKLQFKNYSIDSIGHKDKLVKQIVSLDSTHLVLLVDHQLIKFNTKTHAFKLYWTPSASNASLKRIKKWKDLLFVTTENGAYRIEVKNKTIIDQLFSLNISGGFIGFIDDGKSFYAYSSTQLFELNDNNGFTYRFDLFSKEYDENTTASILHFDNRNILWIGTTSSGLFKHDLKTHKVSRYVHSSNLSTSISSNTILSIMSDNTGILWVGTRFGINKFDSERQNFNHYQVVTGNQQIDNSKVWAIYSSSSPIVWVGGDNGLSRFNIETNSITTYKPILKEVHQSNGVYAIEPALNGFLVGTEEGVKRFDTISNTFISYEHPKNKGRTYSIAKMENGEYYIGNRFGLLRLENNNKITHFEDLSVDIVMPEKANIIRCIKKVNEKVLWLGTEEGVVSFHTQRVNPFRNRVSYPKIADNFITSLWLAKGRLWFGSTTSGVTELDLNNYSIKSISEGDGLANNAINSIIGDDQNNLWISTNKGLSRYNMRSGLITNFNETDGLQNNEFNSNAGFKSQKSELFFGGIEGFNLFIPNEIAINKNPPKMVITGFNLFNTSVPITEDGILNQSISSTDKIDLSYDQKVISFEFAALHYSNPKKNKHAYMLEGFDQDWVYIDNSRIATYTNLNAGNYVFKVKGSNSDDIWSEPLELKLRIHPPFWETWLFRILMVASIFGLIFWYYRSRLKRVRQQKKLLESQVKQRTIEIIKQKEEVEVQKGLVEEEKEKTEKLLLNVLPKETAEELKNRGRSKARSYKRATVMFTDFKGFTQIAENYKPQDLVAKLDSFFIKFDEITEKYDIEKIKTVGDAYLCAGGLPIRNKSNPIDTVLAALHIQKVMHDTAAEMELNNEEPWVLRVGIHTGDLIAGVVGIKRFAYDIWGDTVNIASRLETACEAGMINISGTTYEAVAEFFECEYRGKIPAKNKGEIDMYYVHRIKPELSENEDGLTPNEAFEHYVNLKLYSNINYRNAEKYIVKRLDEELPKGLYYHGIHHTKDVCESVERLAIWEGIRGEELYLLKTAALFHDAGFIESYESNEPIGAQMAKEMLPNFGYTEEQIELIIRLIETTKVPHNPQSHLEELMCDADLDYLGRSDFYSKADTLKKELIKFGKLKEEKDWDFLQVKFLTMHKYFTKSAKERRDPEKQKRLVELKEVLKKYD